MRIWRVFFVGEYLQYYFCPYQYGSQLLTWAWPGNRDVFLVILIVSAYVTKLLVLSLITTLFQKKRVIRTFNRLVLCIPLTVEHSQLCIPEINAPPVSYPSELSIEVNLFCRSVRNTYGCNAFFLCWCIGINVISQLPCEEETQFCVIV